MLSRAVAALDRGAAVAACALVVILLGVVALGVVTRGAGAPLIWTDELSRFLMVWLAVAGWILASRKGIEVRIRYFQDLLPKPAHRAVELAIQLALTVFGGLIAWFAVGLVAKNHDLEATTLPLSMAWMYAPMVLAGIVTTLQGAYETYATLKRPRSLPPPDAIATDIE